MVERASHKSIRDQLISLSVDIEDKSKICALLERKIDNERSLLGKVDASLAEEFESILEVSFKLSLATTVESFTLFIHAYFWDCRLRLETTKSIQDRKPVHPTR